MYDCFNMAYCDNTNALQLHIKVNSENLLPISQKYNAGSLRLPADPSWPKIPQRKLAENINNTIDPPCIVKLSGTPRRSRTVVRTPLNHSPKSTVTKDSAYSSFHQKHISSNYTFEKPPGYADPRFKKVSSVKRNQTISTESERECDIIKKANRSDIPTSIRPIHTKIERPIPENTNIQEVHLQEVKKSDKDKVPEKIKGKKNINENNCNTNQESTIYQKHCVDNLGSMKVNEITEDACKNKIIENELLSKTAVIDANTQVNIAPVPVQENNGQLFFVLDKKLQPHSLNAIQLNTIAMPQECVHQCCNMQVPVIAYQKIPLQVSTSGTNNAIQQCLNCKENSIQNETALSTKRESRECINCNNVESSSKEITVTVSNHTRNALENDVEEHQKLQNIALNNNNERSIKVDNINSSKNVKSAMNISGKLENTKIERKQQESSDSEYYIPNVIKTNRNRNTSQHLKVNNIKCHTSGEETTDSEYIIGKNICRKEFPDITKLDTKTNKIDVDVTHGDGRNSVQNNNQINFLSKERYECFQSVSPSNTIVTDRDRWHQKSIPYEGKTRNKSEQNLYCTKDECIKKLCRNSEPYITFKQRKASAKFSRKARSYFQKNSHSALIDSDYTVVWPNSQYNKYKRSQTKVYKLNNHRLKKNEYNSRVKLLSNEQNIRTNSNLEERNYLKSDQDADLHKEILKTQSKTCLQKECCNSEVSPRTNTDDAVEKRCISPKTQELLHKSYWEYYNRLRHRMKNTGNMEQLLYSLTIDTANIKNGKSDEKYKNELRNYVKLNPELQTLQQCTALSSMINQALDRNLQSDIVQTKQLHTSKTIKTSPTPVTDFQNTNSKKTNINLKNDLTNTVACKTVEEQDKQYLELKSIIFFGGMMYILIVFLPMLYDYFYHEEYDNYENLSYLELVVDYILSSFKEAFGDVFNGAKQIFLYPVRLRTKL